MYTPAAAPTRFDTITELALEAMVRRFYDKARHDAQLGPVFEAGVHDWEAHIATLTAFWSSVMLTSGRYHGRPMQAHMRLPIQPDMFGRWLGLWGETAQELFAPELADRFRVKASTIAKSLQLAMFFRPEDPAASV